ncbi:hypothetical protein ACSQ67_000041 [Phaseolus vulgaris]
MLVVPQGGSGEKCTATGCVGDLNDACPSELKVMSADGREGVACKSACEAFNSPQYCCSGAYGSPDTCKPSSYSEIFKNACPRAYSYAYDDKTSTFTCASADYTITFCPSPPPELSQKASQEQQGGSSATTPLLNNGTMVYEGGFDQSEISWATSSHVSQSRAVAGIVGVAMAMWRFSQLF